METDELARLREEVRELRGRLEACQPGGPPPCRCSCHQGHPELHRPALRTSLSSHEDLPVLQHPGDRSSSYNQRDESSPSMAGDRSSSCHQGDESSLSMVSDRSSSRHQKDEAPSSMSSDGSSSCHQRNESSPSMAGDRSSSCNQRDEAPSSMSSDGSSSRHQRDESSPSMAGDRSSSRHQRNESSPSMAGDRSSSRHQRDESSPSMAGDGSSSCNQRDEASPSMAGDRSSSCNQRDESSPSMAGDRSSSCNQRDESSPSMAGDRSSSCNQRDEAALRMAGDRSSSCHLSDPPSMVADRSSCPGASKLSNAEILRYSRQLVLPEFGVKGQLHLSGSSVLVIGCGGLGCPLAQYLVAAGVGRLGLLDYDMVEVTNLHRQVLHTEERLGTPKAVSVATALQQLNSRVECIPHQVMLHPSNALQLVQQYDIIADCSDNVATRYLVNDACVALGKPLVSASALRWEGQLTVYNHQGGPCYRCLFPTPPPPETVTNCADGGVLGVVPGTLGCLQALEVLKLASGMAPTYSGVLLMYHALDGRFRTIRLRGKRPDCPSCSGGRGQPLLEDYEAFCGSSASDKCRQLRLLSANERLSVHQYRQLLDDGTPHLLIDVRPPVEVAICCLEHSLFIPLQQLEEHSPASMELLRHKMAEVGDGQAESKVITICKLGNDSQKAVGILRKVAEGAAHKVTIMDVAGGLMAWAHHIDPAFPIY